MTDFVWPEVGDYDDPANIGHFAGTENLDGWIEHGLGFSNIDFANLVFDLDGGKAFVQADTATGANSGITLEHVIYNCELDARTSISLTDSAVNHVFVNVNPGNNNSPQVHVDTDNTPPSDTSVKVGEIDTSNNVSSQQWSLLAGDRTVTFPDKAAADEIEPQIPEGTIVYIRSTDRHYFVA